METFGIENIKKALTFAGNITRAFTKALSDDGKITGMEYFSIAMTLPGITPIIKNIADIKDEYLDLDELELEELKIYFSSEFDIPNDDVEVKIEKAFDLVLQIADSITDWMPDEPTE